MGHGTEDADSEKKKKSNSYYGKNQEVKVTQ